MKFYFDESGVFALPATAAIHAVGIVSGVVIPEGVEAAVFASFSTFLKTLPSTAFQNGEVKGRLLDEAGRAGLAQMIVDLPRGALFCPVMLDLTSLVGTPYASPCEAVAAKLIGLQGTCKHAKMKAEIGALAADVGSMSDQQVLRLAAWAKCISRCIRDSIVFHCGEAYNESWTSLRFEIDPVQPSGGTERTSFQFLLPAWVTAWSQDDPFTTIEELHTASHPFVTAWGSPGGIDVGKMFRNNVHYLPSEKSLGIQLADVTATLARRAVLGLATLPNLMNYGFMLTRAIGKPFQAAGMFFLSPPNIAEIERRYAGLADTINATRATVATAYCK